MADSNQKREDDVLRRMLNTPHKKHEPLGGRRKPKSEPQRQGGKE